MSLVVNYTTRIEPQGKRNDYYACENKADLFVLQQDKFIKGFFHREMNSSNGRYIIIIILNNLLKYTQKWVNLVNFRNYYIKRIPYSNLYFIGINKHGKKDTSVYYTTAPKRYTTEPEFTMEGMNKSLLPCHKLKLNDLARRKLSGCYNEHSDVISNI